MARTSKKIRYGAKKKIREGKFFDLTKEEREWFLNNVGKQKYINLNESKVVMSNA